MNLIHPQLLSGKLNRKRPVKPNAMRHNLSFSLR